jgi:hypothetical protein
MSLTPCSGARTCRRPLQHQVGRNAHPKGRIPPGSAKDEDLPLSIFPLYRTAGQEQGWGQQLFPGLLQYTRPVFVCLLNIAWDVLLPLYHDFLAAVQVKLALDYLPDRWISFCDAPHRNLVGSVSTILWGIFFWIRFKQIKMLGTDKTPFRTHPMVSKFFCALERLSLDKVGNRIIALDS